MFNKKKEVKTNIQGLLGVSIPSKKEYLTMFEMLRDAEKYDNEDEKECRDLILIGVCEYIERLMSKSLHGVKK